VGVNSYVGDPVPAGHLTLQLDGRGKGRSGRESRPDDGGRGRSRTGGARTRRRAISMEDLRRKYSWWPRSSSGKDPVALIDMGAAEAEEAVPRSIKSTHL
jgi:hypothetical protein